MGSADQALSADQIAIGVGLRNRLQLSRSLGRHGLPPVSVLRDWARFLYWLGEWEAGGLALSSQAWGSGKEPSVCYRTVRRVTAMSWREARALSAAEWSLRFGAILEAHHHCPVGCSERSPS